jgi:hypothetical protein
MGGPGLPAAQLTPRQASAPVVAGQQAVLLDRYSPNVPALREHLFENGVNVSSMAYVPKGEVGVEDPYDRARLLQSLASGENVA